MDRKKNSWITNHNSQYWKMVYRKASHRPSPHGIWDIEPKKKKRIPIHLTALCDKCEYEFAVPWIRTCAHNDGFPYSISDWHVWWLNFTVNRFTTQLSVSVCVRVCVIYILYTRMNANIIIVDNNNSNNSGSNSSTSSRSVCVQFKLYRKTERKRKRERARQSTRLMREWLFRS